MSEDKRLPLLIRKHASSASQMHRVRKQLLLEHWARLHFKELIEMLLDLHEYKVNRFDLIPRISEILNGTERGLSSETLKWMNLEEARMRWELNPEDPDVLGPLAHPLPKPPESPPKEPACPTPSLSPKS